jgi:phosphoribosylaminoimidazole-succinocarboxamide synthase
MSDEWVQIISQRYIDLFEKVTGTKFIPQDLSSEEMQIKINEDLKRLGID